MGPRRFGASQPMRITASWFGSLDPPHTRLWRDRSALERELPSNRLLAEAPTAFDGAAVLGTVKAALRVVAEEATSLDSSCARRLATVAGRDEETVSDRTKKRRKKDGLCFLKLLDKKSPIQRSPDAVVVISSSREGDRPVESLEVKAPGGRREYRSDPYRGASNLAGRSECAN